MLNYLLEASICLGIFYLFYTLVLQQQTSYQYNRFYLLLASLLSFLLPLLEIPINIIAVENSSTNATAEGYLMQEAFAGGQTTAAFSTLWLVLLLGLYLAGAICMLFLFSKQCYQLYCLIWQNDKVHQQGYYLVQTDGNAPVSSFLHYLFWNRHLELSEQEKQQILIHEETHIKQKHSYDMLYMGVLKIVFWFHPFVYLYEKALIEAHEYMADAAVLRKASPKAYARLLGKRLFEGMDLSLVNHFYTSKTLKRIAMMKRHQQKTPWYRLVLAAPVLATLFLIFSCQPTEGEMEQLAIEKSYDDVQSSLKKTSDDILTIEQKYYPDHQEFMNAVAETGNQVEALRAANASRQDIQAYEKLFIQYRELQEQQQNLPDPDGIFMVVEDQPEPVDGMAGFYTYIKDHLEYPLEARKRGVEGRVFIQFIVDEYGELSDFQALKGIGAGCDEAAIKALKGAPAWIPGKQKGKPVKVKMVMPITFALGQEAGS